MKNFFRLSFCLLCLSLFSAHTFADEIKIGNVLSNTIESTSTGTKEKEREKTINDINTFLIESYKLKIDKILADLNSSIVRATKNDSEAQVKLLKKIQGDITAKEDLLDSKQVSQNRKKILSAIFSYIQGNIDEKIQKISRERAEK